MAVTLVLGVPQRVTLGAANVMTRIDPPANATRLRILFETNDGKYSVDSTLTDGAALAALAYDLLLANIPDTTHSVPGTSGGRSRNLDSAAAASNSRRFFLGSATGATVVEVTALR